MSTTMIGSEIANFQRSNSAVDFAGCVIWLTISAGRSLPGLPYIVMLVSDTNDKSRIAFDLVKKVK